ncbi:hypothetical protein J2T56_003268 [Natronobacillus azotifigens]|uniref:Uncharacterized protein n=1 Tax=Natronobacillus azotifigens TaxID=472978 RepID=A0A9J6RH53_9BACI|nr:hypothetical protein [Natronobacillus azotifigens]MCZ0704659.1 hypothetical protein [Natronobacillus azotifigens]
MLGMLISEIEQKELEYIIKREMEEILLDIESDYIDPLIKNAMMERYQVLFQLFRRIANQHEIVKYIR